MSGSSGRDKGHVFVVSGPSGVGKSAIETALLKSDPTLHQSISHTTRKKRESEVDGVDYHFVSIEDFKRLQDSGEMLETASIFGNFYGTSQQAITQTADLGRDVLLIIDWQGARNLRPIREVSSLFLLPPSLETLEQRIRHRSEDTEEVIAHRIQQAKSDMQYWNEYDWVIINDEFEVALNDIQLIIQGVRENRVLKTGATEQQIRAILDC